MTLVLQRWNNPWHARATGAATQCTLEDGCLGPPSGVRRAGGIGCAASPARWRLPTGVCLPAANRP